MRVPLRIVLPALASFGLVACSSSDPITSQGLASSSVTSEKIADKSITNPKLADGAVDARALAQASVTTPAIADNAVTSTTIADGSIETSKIAAKAVVTGSIDDKAVSTAKLNDGAVTAVKMDANAAVMKLNGITGNVTLQAGQNIAVTPSGNTIAIGISGNVNAATLGTLPPAAFARRDTHVLTVAKSTSDGDYNTINAALAAITNASSTNPYLIHVGPGVYAEQVQMKPNVDIEGSGVNVTLISLPAQAAYGQATVIGAPNSEIRNLAIESTGPGAGTGTGFAANGTAANITNVRISARGAQYNDYGLYASGTGSSIVARNVTITIASAGSRAYGAYADSGGKIVLRDSSVSAPTGSGMTSNNSLFDGGGGLIYVANTMVDGPASGQTNAINCIGAFSTGYTPLTASCG